jgi:hypothetical protein
LIYFLGRLDAEQVASVDATIVALKMKLKAYADAANNTMSKDIQLLKSNEFENDINQVVQTEQNSTKNTPKVPSIKIRLSDIKQSKRKKQKLKRLRKSLDKELSDKVESLPEQHSVPVKYPIKECRVEVENIDALVKPNKASSVVSPIQSIKKEIPSLENFNHLSPAMISIPADVLSQNEKNTPILPPSEIVLKKLRPWMSESTHQKSLDACKRMLENSAALSALFKCMGSNCEYFSSKKDLFVRHLSFHVVNFKNYDKNYQHCPYCSFIGEMSSLASHVVGWHGFCR